MSEPKARRVTPDPAFAVQLPAGWDAEPDPEEGVLMHAENGVGLLHLVAFALDADDAPDPAEELWTFLEDQGIELQEDEVEDVELAGDALLSLCEYLSEDEDETDEEGATYWLVGVAIAPGVLVLASYSCPAGAQGEEREVVRDILATLELQAPA